jgi:hypothetical protein
VRRGQSLWQLRNPAGSEHSERPFLMAARDEPPKSEPPGGGS